MNSLYISRFRLFHKGYLEVVKSILEIDDDNLVMGVGAAQCSHTLENPFTGEERVEMIVSSLVQLKLIGRVRAILIDETDIGYDEWAPMVQRICAPFGLVYSNSELVRLLFERIGYRTRGVPKFKRKEYSFDCIRRKVVNNEHWQDLVPEPVIEVMRNLSLDNRLITLSQKTL